MSTDFHFESQATADQYQLDRQISNFRVTRSRAKQLTELEQRRDALRAPVYTLPDDILLMIFRVGAKMEHRLDTVFIVDVSQVVSRWRRLVLCTPSFWTSLEIALPATEWEHYWWMTCLNRSGALPLAIDIELSDVEDPPFLLEFTLDYEPLNLFTALPRCRELAIRSESAAEDTLMKPWNMPFAAPLRLEKLWLSAFRFHTLSSLCDLLQSCPRLMVLTLQAMLFDHPDPADRIIQLEHLDSLTMEEMYVDGESNMHAVLQCLRMPGLRTLSLHDWDGVVSPVMDFSHVSWLSVVTYRAIRSSVIIDLIGGMPALKDLCLSVVIEDPEAELQILPNISIPHLVTIDFAFSDQVDRFACWLVEQTGRGLPEVITVRTVMVSSFTESGDYFLSVDSREWMKERGIEVLLC